MGEEIKLNRIVSNIIGENNYSHCRLCLNDIAEEYFGFEDLVPLESDSNKIDLLPLKDVFTFTLGFESEIKEIPGIDAVCPDCVKKTLESAQFFNKCKQSTELLTNVVDNLYHTLNIDYETIPDSQRMCIIVSEHDTKVILMDKPSKQKKSHSIQKTKQFECSECNEHFESVQEIKMHNITYHCCVTCVICLETFAEEAQLEFHIGHKHKTETEANLQFHSNKDSSLNKEEHSDRTQGVYVCKVCGKSCKGRDKLLSHERHHKETETYECPQCGKKYQTKSFYANHKNLCLKGLLDPHPTRSNLERSFSCEKCGKSYSTFGGLRVHMRFEHGNAKYHVCHHCGKKFTAPSCLKTHMVTHTREKNFHCEICNRNFVSKEALLYHTRRHTGEKPYSCNICQERFVNASARAEHIKYKHIGPTLQCQMCSRKFVTSFFLKKHMERHHDPRSKLYHTGIRAELQFAD